MSGLEVDDVQDLSKLSDLVVVGEIITLEKNGKGFSQNLNEIKKKVEKLIY